MWWIKWLGRFVLDRSCFKLEGRYCCVLWAWAKYVALCLPYIPQDTRGSYSCQYTNFISDEKIDPGLDSPSSYPPFTSHFTLAIRSPGWKAGAVSLHFFRADVSCHTFKQRWHYLGAAILRLENWSKGASSDNDLGRTVTPSYVEGRNKPLSRTKWPPCKIWSAVGISR